MRTYVARRVTLPMLIALTTVLGFQILVGAETLDDDTAEVVVIVSTGSVEKPPTDKAEPEKQYLTVTVDPAPVIGVPVVQTLPNTGTGVSSHTSISAPGMVLGSMALLGASIGVRRRMRLSHGGLTYTREPVTIIAK